MATDPEIRELSPQPAVTEVAVTDADGIPSVVDAAFPRLFGRLADLGVEPAGPPYIRYLRTGAELELELGIPVGPDAGQSSGLPGGRAAVLVHVGPFDGLRDACARLQEWAGDRAAGPLWESYVTNPREEPDSSQWITEIFLPLR
jgi:effector-binding domain-containing protein